MAVSKTRPIADIQAAYNAGQRIFGENKALELAAKHEQLPEDIEWHVDEGHENTEGENQIHPPWASCPFTA